MSENKKTTEKTKRQDNNKTTTTKKVEINNKDAQLIPEQRTVEILDILKRLSDERHPVSQKFILENMETTNNAQTLSRALLQILCKINPVVYEKDNDGEYRVKYRGYENDLIAEKEIYDSAKKKLRHNDEYGDVDMRELDEEEEEALEKYSRSPEIKDLYYVHDFTYTELDQLIDAVNLTNKLSDQEKTTLISKLINTASDYYETPFFKDGKRTFSVLGTYENRYFGNTMLHENLRVIRDAIEKRHQIRFNFNYYNENKELKPRLDEDGNPKEYVMNPYYVMVINGRYYLLCNVDWSSDVSTYRIDLMSEVKPKCMGKTKYPEKRKPISQIKDMPRVENWKPAEYMSQHLYAYFDKPKTIRLKLNRSRYTMLHDYFGEYYNFVRHIDDKYDLVTVKCSPEAMAVWAVQMGDFVEVLDDDMRGLVCKKIKTLVKRYNKELKLRKIPIVKKSKKNSK